MMMTQFAAVIVSKVGPQRQLAHPLSTVQQPYLRALGVPVTYFPALPSGERDEEGKSRVKRPPGCQSRGGQTERKRSLRGGEAIPRLYTLTGLRGATPA